MSVKVTWGRSNPVSKVLFFLIILYLLFSAFILLCKLGVVSNVFTSDGNVLLIVFSIISFSFVIVIAVFHLVTLILRRKRVTDYQP